MSQAVLEVEQLCLDLPLSPAWRAKGLTGAEAVGGRLTTIAGRPVVRALDNVSFSVTRGTRLGVIGSNGAGKSTLLRAIAGIYQPSQGRVVVRGSVATLFTNRLYINDHVSGRENILLSGLLLGLDRETITRITPEVIEFSELGDFIDLPLSTYSSGMATRLGFALATTIRREILIIDEVFGAGDRDFQGKARARMVQLIEESGTLLLASHDARLIEEFCDTALWLEHGEVRGFGPVVETLAAYERGGGVTA